MQQQFCQFPPWPAGVSMVLETHHWEENISFAVMGKINWRDWSEREHLFPPPYNPQTNLFVFLLSVLYSFVCLSLFSLSISTSYRHSVYFTGVLFTWPQERERSWQPSRPEAWRARLQERRDRGRRSSLASVPETHTHTQNRVKIIKACAARATLWSRVHITQANPAWAFVERGGEGLNTYL